MIKLYPDALSINRLGTPWSHVSIITSFYQSLVRMLNKKNMKSCPAYSKKVA